MRQSHVSVGAVVLLLLAGAPARAWENHALLTAVALGADPKLPTLDPVRVESLDEFLAPNESGLGALLDEEEAWARKNVPAWPPRPEALRFATRTDAPSLRVRFLEAIRINPTRPYAPFVQVLPGAPPHPERAPLAHDDVVPPGMAGPIPRVFASLTPGELAQPVEIAATGSDEPDYGLDFGLFSDNGTAWGARYGYGAQSVGNPKLAFSTQAPFHMGFFHEADIVYTLAGFLRRMYPEARIHLYLALSRYALSTGHDYWGYRFLGWALHYLQDLSNPWHATLMPGKGAGSTIWANVKSMIGFGGAKAAMITRATNRHLALEDFVMRELHGAIIRGEFGAWAIEALADGSIDAHLGALRDETPRAAITVHSHDLADVTDAALVSALPARWIDDPTYTFSVTEPTPDTAAAARASADAGTPLRTVAAELLRAAGGWTRIAARTVREGAR